MDILILLVYTVPPLILGYLFIYFLDNDRQWERANRRKEKKESAMLKKAAAMTPDEAESWLIKKQISKGQIAEYIYQIYKWYAHGYEKDGISIRKNEKIAFAWLLKAAEDENPEKQNEIGMCYSSGRGVQEDKAKAFVWLLKAAQNGDVFSQHLVSSKCKKGEGTSQDYGKAFYWAAKAYQNAKQQSSEYLKGITAEGLGKLYFEGIGTEPNIAKAISLYTEAAGYGDITATLDLAHRYQVGHDVKIDLDKAAKLYYSLKDTFVWKGHAENCYYEIISKKYPATSFVSSSSPLFASQTGTDADSSGQNGVTGSAIRGGMPLPDGMTADEYLDSFSDC